MGRQTRLHGNGVDNGNSVFRNSHAGIGREDILRHSAAILRQSTQTVDREIIYC